VLLHKRPLNADPNLIYLEDGRIIPMPPSKRGQNLKQYQWKKGAGSPNPGGKRKAAK
jgi:hypothetical protein